MPSFLYEMPWETGEDDRIDQLEEETYDTERKKRKMCEVNAGRNSDDRDPRCDENSLMAISRQT